MNIKKNVGIIFGGKSAEHDVSIKSATAIVKNIDRNIFNITLIYINKNGDWAFVNETDINNPESGISEYGSFIPWDSSSSNPRKVDIFFPVLHGPNGEDGKIQGIFEMAGMPYVGADSLSSNLAMDKAVSKNLFIQAGIDTAKFKVFTENEPDVIGSEIENSFGFPCFVKPCSLGSSVGINKVTDKTSLKSGIKEAFKYDTKIIIEEEIKGMEFEVSVKGNRNPVASRAGSFIPSKEFYDYDDKYILGKTKFMIPANIPRSLEKKLQETALIAYKTLFLNGFSRVDFFIEDKTEKILINEINTIPGFTEISMFPKLWEVDGISFKSLITELITLGFEHSKNLFSKRNSPE